MNLPFFILHPWIVTLIIPLAAVIIAVLRIRWVKFKTKEELQDYLARKKNIKIVVGIMRILIVLFLLFALASPFTYREIQTIGDPHVTMFNDNSSSYSIFQQGVAEELKSKIEGQIPVQIKTVAYGERSAIADNVIMGVEGNDNLLLITDGNANEGRSLGDLVTFATMVNSTISVVSVPRISEDASVKISGPRETIVGKYSFDVVVKETTDTPATLRVSLDDTLIMETEISKSDVVQGSVEFDRAGYFRLKAELIPRGEDKFFENNFYYKSVKVLPRPSVLIVSKKQTPLETPFRNFYTLSVLNAIPEDIKRYNAVILNDLSLADIADKTQLLTNYITDGNGLFVIGGVSAFDKGSYKDSAFEALLPCQVGVAEKKQDAPVNIVIAIDVSGSTGGAFKGDSISRKVDVEKAIALSIVDDLRPEDKVGIIVFNDFGFVIQPMQTLVTINRPELERKVKSLTNTGGTRVWAGIKEAYALMASSPGTKNIIIISDGMTQQPGSALALAKDAASKGVKIYSVGVGANTDKVFMSNLAKEGNGYYFEPTEQQKIKLIFDKNQEPEQQGDKMNLITLDTTHFITNGLELNAYVTGINFIVPKNAARMLIATSKMYPVLTAWNFGLGRVVCLGADINLWPGNLLNEDNAVLFARTTNWAVGDPAKKNNFDIDVKDTTIGKPTTINIISTNPPFVKGFEFSKTGDNKYTATYTPTETGFKQVLSAFIGVNANTEYENIGMNEQLYNIAGITGGKVFTKENVTEIIDFIKENSKRTRVELTFFRWPFVIIALLLLLAEIFLRRFMQKE